MKARDNKHNKYVVKMAPLDTSLHSAVSCIVFEISKLVSI